MIFIRAHFGDWKPATEEQARRFAKQVLFGMLAMSGAKAKAYVNERHLRGITCEQLQV